MDGVVGQEENDYEEVSTEGFTDEGVVEEAYSNDETEETDEENTT